MSCMYCGKDSQTRCCSAKCENKYIIYKYRSSEHFFPLLVIMDVILFSVMPFLLMFLAESFKNESLFGQKGFLFYAAAVITLDALYFFLYPYTFKRCRITRCNKALSFLFGIFLLVVSAVLISI